MIIEEAILIKGRLLTKDECELLGQEIAGLAALYSKDKPNTGTITRLTNTKTTDWWPSSTQQIGRKVAALSKSTMKRSRRTMISPMLTTT